MLPLPAAATLLTTSLPISYNLCSIQSQTVSAPLVCSATPPKL